MHSYNTFRVIQPIAEGTTVMPSPTIKLHATLDLDATPAQLWPLLSDTGRLDRAIGLPSFERSVMQTDLSYEVSSHYLGVPVAWVEYPYEWVFEQWYQVEREFHAPLPMKRLMTRTTLTPLPGDRTHLDVIVEFEPRGVIGRTAAPLFIQQKLMRDLLRTYRNFGALARAPEPMIPPAHTPSVNAARLNSALERLRQFGMRDALTERLAQHLRSADDPDVIRMRPFMLADMWDEPRLDVLRLFLYATRAGLLDLEWQVLCPNCRGPSVQANNLYELAADAHCSSCNVRYDMNFDESVELRFTVSPDIREAVDAAYCIGGPAHTRHIVAHVSLPPQAEKTIRLQLAPGDYRLRTRQLPATTLVHVAAEHTNAATAVHFGADELVATQPDLAAGEVELTLNNTTNTRLLLVVEQTAWSAQAVSAAFVSTLTEFRQLFSSQVLAPGLGVAIRNLTFLFSDLKGSTALYDMIGDSPAYARVRDHFDVMKTIIAQRRGALVKTIGDAVMAVFASAEDAFEAAIDIQREFTLGAIARGEPMLCVKLGLHRGPCIAVNANELLDYFGSTVNIAARVQNESIGGDIMVTPEVLSDPGVHQILAREHPDAETMRCELKGFAQAFTLTRLWISANEPVAQPA